jgi:hypothetical protein
MLINVTFNIIGIMIIANQIFLSFKILKNKYYQVSLGPNDYFTTTVLLYSKLLE